MVVFPIGLIVTCMLQVFSHHSHYRALVSVCIRHLAFHRVVALQGLRVGQCSGRHAGRLSVAGRLSHYSVSFWLHQLP